MNTYLHDELGVATTDRYVVVDPAIADAWQWSPTGRGSPTALSVGDDLRDTMISNPELRIFSANGVYDLTSPAMATEYTLSHLRLPPGRQADITFGDYPSGHMVYVSTTSRAELKHDLASFYEHR